MSSTRNTRSGIKKKTDKASHPGFSAQDISTAFFRETVRTYWTVRFPPRALIWFSPHLRMRTKERITIEEYILTITWNGSFQDRKKSRGY